MTLDIDTILKFASLAISVGAMVYAFFANRKKDVDERFREGSKRMDRHDGRIAALEQTIQSMPEKEDIHSLQLKLAEMNGSLMQMTAVMEGNAKVMARLETVVTRHEDHLLEGGKAR